MTISGDGEVRSVGLGRLGAMSPAAPGPSSSKEARVAAATALFSSTWALTFASRVSALIFSVACLSRASSKSAWASSIWVSAAVRRSGSSCTLTSAGAARAARRAPTAARRAVAAALRAWREGTCSTIWTSAVC